MKILSRGYRGPAAKTDNSSFYLKSTAPKPNVKCVWKGDKRLWTEGFSFRFPWSWSSIRGKACEEVLCNPGEYFGPLDGKALVEMFC